MHASMAYLNGAGSLPRGARRAARDHLKLLNTLLAFSTGSAALEYVGRWHGRRQSRPRICRSP